MGSPISTHAHCKVPDALTPGLRPHDQTRPTLIGQLPNELLTAVFHFFQRANEDYLARQKEHRNIILVCHHFRAIATPLLYNAYEANSQQTHLILLRSILLSPHLGIHLRSVIHVHGKPQRRISDDPRKRIVQYLRELDLAESAAHWPAGFDEEENDYGIAAVLCLAPRVERIEIGRSDFTFDGKSYVGPDVKCHTRAPVWLLPIVYAALQEPFGKVHTFENLVDISLQIRGISMKYISTLLMLPSLRRIELVGQYKFGKVEVNEWICPPRTSRVTSLTLPTGIPVSIFSHLMDSCKILRELHWWELPYFRSEINYGPFHPTWFAAIIPFLLIHADTLNILDYIWPMDGVYGPSDLENCKSLSYLHAVTEINYCNCYDYHDLIRLDCIPRNIRLLKVSTNEQNIPLTCSILEKLSSRPLDFPSLADIEITIHTANVEKPIPLDILEAHIIALRDASPLHTSPVEVSVRKVKGPPPRIQF